MRATVEHKVAAVLAALDMATAAGDAPALSEAILSAAAQVMEGGVIEVDGDPSEEDFQTIVEILDPLAVRVGLDGAERPAPVEGLGFVARVLGALRPIVTRVWPLARGLVQRYGPAILNTFRKGFPRLLRAGKGLWFSTGGKWVIVAGGVLLGSRWVSRSMTRLGRGALDLAVGAGSLLGVALIAWAILTDGGN